MHLDRVSRNLRAPYSVAGDLFESRIGQPRYMTNPVAAASRTIQQRKLIEKKTRSRQAREP